MDNSIKLCEVPNTPEGREKIRSLQKGLRNTPYRIVLYGRYTGKKQLAEQLWKSDHPYCFDSWGNKVSVEGVKFSLRGRIPLSMSQGISVYLKHRPRSKWIQNESGRWESVPTQWA